jgi:hypothetical protein
MDLFLTELEKRTNQYGSLWSNTVMIAGSELGRFPRINHDLGKDHFNETSLMLFGGGINGGNAFGKTGKMMQALPASLTTGLPVDVGGGQIGLDDVGTTLLHMAGIDPSVHGYNGTRLRFLEAP